jgi:hypothetical protein
MTGTKLSFITVFRKQSTLDFSSGTSVAKGPKFRPQNTKGAENNCVGPEGSGAEHLPDLSKKGRKGAELFLKFKTAKFLTEN